MTTKTESQKRQPEQILTRLNPYSDNFNFELWSHEVRQQMLTTLQKRLASHRARLSK